MHTTSLFPLWFKAAIRMHCVYSRQLEFGTIFQSPNGLDAFWSHRLPRRHSLVHSHSGILITNTPLLFFWGGGQSFVSVSPSVGHASISFVCQQGVFKALSPRLLTLSWCGAGSPAVLPSEFASPCPVLPIRRVSHNTRKEPPIHRQISPRFVHRYFSYGLSFLKTFHRLSGPTPPFPAIMARTRHMTAKARSTATNSSSPRPRPPPTPATNQVRDASSTPQNAPVANPDPFTMGGSPSMMERFFPAGLPRRYTSQAEAVPSSIGSVISSSQERYGTLRSRRITSFRISERSGVWLARGREDEEEGGTALQLKHWDGQVAQSLCVICRARSQPLLRAASVVRPF